MITSVPYNPFYEFTCSFFNKNGIKELLNKIWTNNFHIIYIKKHHSSKTLNKSLNKLSNFDKNFQENKFHLEKRKTGKKYISKRRENLRNIITKLIIN